MYGLCDDYLKIMQHREERQSRLNDVQVMTIALVAAREFGTTSLPRSTLCVRISMCLLP